MKKLLLLLLTIFIVIGCQPDDECSIKEDCEQGEICISGECKKENVEPSLSFSNIKDGDSIFGGQDEDTSKEGVQYTIVAKTIGLIEGDSVNLEICNLDCSKKKSVNTDIETKDGKLVAIFKQVDFSEFDGKTNLTLKKEEATAKILVNVQGVYGISITSPTSGATLTEDKDANKYYLQSDVLVEVTGLRDSVETIVYLDLYKNDNIVTYSSYPTNGSVLFENVDFLGGAYKLKAHFTVDDKLYETEFTNITVNYDGQCNVALTPVTETKINVAYLIDNNISDKMISLIAKSNCPENFKVSYLINEGETGETTLESTLAKAGDENISVVKYIFAEDEDRGNIPSKVKVSVKNNENNEVATVEALYYVDTILPELELAITKTDLTVDDDTDFTTIGIQFPVTVNMDKFADGQNVIIESNRGGNWHELTSFTKDGISKEVILTLEGGSYALRARAMDINNQEGLSNLLGLNVVLSDCTIDEVKMGGNQLLTDSVNTVNNDLMDSDGKVHFDVKTSLACNGYNLVIKKGDVIEQTILLDNEQGLKDVILTFINNESTNLTFEIATTYVSVTYPMLVTLMTAELSRIDPADMELTYVNATNNTDAYLKDLNPTEDGAQINVKVNIKHAMNGTLELIASTDGTELSLDTKNILTDDEDVTFSVTLPESKLYTLKFKATDSHNIVTIVDLYHANVDVINPGNLSNIAVSANAADARNLKINLSWDQSNTGDDLDSGAVSKYVIKYRDFAPFNVEDFEMIAEDYNTKVITIDNPSMDLDQFATVISATFSSNYFIAVRAYDDLGNKSDVLTIDSVALFPLDNTSLDMTGYDNSQYFVSFLDSVGDLNSDGIEDFVVTQMNAAGFHGKVYVYYGTDNPATIGHAQVITGINLGSLGSCIAGGDFNGDGKQDLMIGESFSNNFRGSVNIVYGNGGQLDFSNKTIITNSSLDDDAALKKGSSKFAEFGVSCNFIGDINNDGKEDIIIGQDHTTDGGRAFILAGRSDNSDIVIDQNNIDDKTVMLSHDMPASGTKFGFRVKNIGDINKDGVNDIAVTALVDDFSVGHTSDGGKTVSIFYLNATIFSQTELMAKLDNTGDASVFKYENSRNFGKNINSGDLDGDGNLDLVFSVTDSVGFFVVYGNGTRFTGSEPYINIKRPTIYTESITFGRYIEVKDFDNDGKDDIIMGVKGNVLIYLGNSTRLTNTSQPNITIDLGNEGTATINLTEVNGNDNTDLIICNSESKDCILKIK